jgi:hypothetical protein
MSGRHVFGYYPLAQQPFPYPMGLEATQGVPGGHVRPITLISNGATRSYEDDSQGWTVIRRKQQTVRGRK